MFRTTIKRVLFTTALFSACVPAYPQVNTATVSGTVMDATGALVAGASIKLQSTTTNVVRTETSGAEGRFRFDFVIVGPYTMTVAKPGFRSEVLTDLSLDAGAALDLPISLSVEVTQSTVTVSSGDADAIQTTTVDQESIIGNEKLNGLPVQHQDWTTMLPLSTATIKPLSTSTASSTSPQGSGLNVNGLASVGYNLTVDGTNATSNPEFTAFNFYQGPNIINTVNNDAIAEVSFTKGIAPATVGGTLSSNINLITKSGSNQFHGSLYEINEEGLYDARNQFLTTRRGKTFNLFGGSIGGRIIPDKFFFFGSYEGARLNTFTPVTGTVPTPYLVANSPAVYAPLLALFPSIAQPSNPTALTGTYSGASSQKQTDGNGVARLDYYFNPQNQLAVRYIRARPNDLIPNLIPSNPETYEGHTDAVNTNYTHIGQTWTENSRFAFNQLKLNRIQQGYFESLPVLTYAGFSSQGGTLFPQHGNFTTFEEGVAFVHGKHSVQFGGIVQRQNASRFKLTTATIAYSNATDWNNNTPDSVLDSVGSLPAGTPIFGWVTWQYGGYIQDDYRVSSNLTLNLGLRYDYYTVPKEYLGRVFNRGISTTDPSLGYGFGPFRPANSMYDATHSNVQPRVGFAWMPYGKQTTVVRGGGGSFAANHTIYGGPVDTYGLAPGIPLNFTLNKKLAEQAGLKYPVNEANYFTDLAALQANGTLATDIAFENVAGYFPDPYSFQYFLGLEQQLPDGLVLETDFIQTRGLHLNFFETQNLPGRVTDVAPVPNFGTFYQFLAGDRSNFNGLEVKLTKRLQYGLSMGATYTWSKVLSFGDADLLQPTEVQDNNNPAGDYGPAPFDIRNRFVINGVWDLPLNQWTGTHSRSSVLLLGGWQFSGIFTGQTGLPINVTDSASSYPADRPDWAPGAQYVGGYRTFTKGGVKSDHQYLTPCCTTGYKLVPFGPANAQIRPGTLQRYSLYAPGYEDLDASLSKSLIFSDNIRFQLRMDAFNALNHTNLTGIVATINSSTFGQLTSATQRTIQIGGRLTF
jgi:outer membrane receptor protein involved in Fe transport